MANPETAEWINGPKLVEWLEERDRLPLIVDKEKTGECAHLRRRMSDWRAGAQVSIEAADKWLTLIGCHISELPDDFWEDAKPRKSRNYTPEEKAEIIAIIQRGEQSAWMLAKERGINHKTVWSWMKRVAA